MKKHTQPKKLVLMRETLTSLYLQSVVGGSANSSITSCNGLRCSNVSVCDPNGPNPLCN